MAQQRKRTCQFCRKHVEWIDYKDAGLLRRHMGTWSKIRSAKDTGTCARHQRLLAEAVKRGRFLALVPYATR